MFRPIVIELVSFFFSFKDILVRARVDWRVVKKKIIIAFKAEKCRVKK